MGGARELLSLGGLAVGGHVGGGGEGAGQRYGSVEVLLLLEHPLASTKTQLLFDVLRERPTSLLRDPLKRPFALPVPRKDWLLINHELQIPPLLLPSAGSSACKGERAR